MSPEQDERPLNVLSIDVEDYYHVSAFDPYIQREQWPQYESRVVHNTNRILDLLDHHSISATFFVLGWIAERFPDLIREIDSRGHEIGSHSYWHRLVYTQTRQAFREDLIRSRAAIEQAIGKVVTCYRAPSFSITEKSRWALDILAQEGFQVDSSIFPVRHDRYGIPDSPRDIHQLKTSHSEMLTEYPATVLRFWGVNLPVSGGGYFRLYPYALTRRLLRRVNRQGHGFMFYFHPWEIDPNQPKLRIGSPITRFRHYVNLRRTYDKLDRLCREFRFGRLSDAMEEYKLANSPPCRMEQN